MMETIARKRLDAAAKLSFSSYALTTVVIPVSLVAITRDLNLSLTQAGSFSLISSIVIFTLLIASVPAASKFGKIRLLKLAQGLIAVGLLLFLRSQSYVYAMMVLVVIACGQGIAEGLLTPLVEDIHPGDDGSHQLLQQAAWPFGIIFGTVVLGEALSRGMSWQNSFLIVAFICIAVSLIYPSARKVNLPRSRSDFSHAGELFLEPFFWIMSLILFASGAVEGAFAFWTASYIQVEFHQLARAGAWGIGIFALGMAVGRIVSTRLINRFGLRLYLFLSGLTILLMSLGFPAVKQVPTLYAFVLVIGLAVAPLWPCVQTYTVRRMEKADPTMVMAFLSCFGILGYSGSSFVMGIIGDAYGLRMSFLVVPVMALLLCLLVLVAGLRKTTRFDV